MKPGKPTLGMAIEMTDQKSGTETQTKRVMEAIMQLLKMDVAALEQAFKGAD